MLSREPISLTMCCYTKEERGLVTEQFGVLLYTCALFGGMSPALAYALAKISV